MKMKLRLFAIILGGVAVAAIPVLLLHFFSDRLTWRQGIIAITVATSLLVLTEKPGKRQLVAEMVATFASSAVMCLLFVWWGDFFK